MPFMYSTIDDILTSDEFTVLDVLKSDDLIQEVNGFNEGLLSYLSKPDVAQALIRYG